MAKTTITKPTSSIVGDIVWNDANGNGIQDAGEQGLGGVKVQVLGKDASGAFTVVVAETTTAANGSYGFTGLKSGTAYQLHVVAPAGYTASGANKGSDDTLDSDFNAKTGNTASFKLVEGENHLNLDAGFYMPAPAKTGSIGDRVWNDADGDGIQDKGETGIGGVTVKLENAGGTVLQTTTTAADGSYHFDKVAAGKYKVEFVAPQDYLFTTQGANGSTTANDSNADAHGLTQQFTLAEGKTNNTIDAGLIYCPPAPPPAPKPASLGDFVWNDTNQNGIQDSGEAGIGGVTVKLEDTSGAVLKTTTTAADGSYHFNDLVAGSYKLEFVKPTDYVFTGQSASGSTSENDSNADINGVTQLFKLVAGQSDQTIDAGLIYNPPPPPPKPAALGDFVWNDTNGNGIQDSGEAGIAGVTVNLLNDGVVFKTTTTAADGSYHFDNLLADHYKVQFVAPQDYVFSAPGAAGSTTANDSNADASGLTQDITLVPGQTDNTIDAGLHLKRGSLGDFVWSDTNGNGIQDSGEAGIKGVTVKLEDSQGNVLQTTTTGSDGSYHFDNLSAGSYQVQFVAPTNYAFTSQSVAGSTVNNDSNANASGLTKLFTLMAGQTDNSIDAGLVRTASLGDFVWVEERAVVPDGINSNLDGIQAGPYYDTPAAKIKVSLTGAGADGIFGTADDIHEQTTTDATGHYLFANLSPGDYKLHFDSSVIPDVHESYYGGAVTIDVTHTWGLEHATSDGALDSDVDANGDTAVIHLAAGENNMDVDAVIWEYLYAPHGSPLVLDLDGDGVHTTPLGANGSATFDLLANGTPVRSGWLSSGDAFLAVDSNGNGKIDSRAELFGGLGQHDGYAQLASYDTNHDGVVDAKDADFAKLLVWQDANGNHQTDPGELRTLAQAGIASLNVAYVDQMVADGSTGNLIGDTGLATRSDGSSVTVSDVWFQIGAQDATPTMSDLLTPSNALLDNALGHGARMHAQPVHAVSSADSTGSAGLQLAQLMAEHASRLAS